MSRDTLHRLGGLACLVAAAAFGWFGIWRPLQAAQAHAAEISYSSKIFVLVPTCLVFGLFFVVAGARWPYRDAERQRPTIVGWVLLVVTAVAAIAGYIWFGEQFKAFGYTSG